MKWMDGWMGNKKLSKKSSYFLVPNREFIKGENHFLHFSQIINTKRVQLIG